MEAAPRRTRYPINDDRNQCGVTKSSDIVGGEGSDKIGSWDTDKGDFGRSK